jgi:hypothetical protein
MAQAQSSCTATFLRLFLGGGPRTRVSAGLGLEGVLSPASSSLLVPCGYICTFRARCGCWRFSMVGIRDAGYVQEMLTAARLASRKACCAQHQLDSMQPCGPAGESGWTAGPQVKQAISRRTQERAKSCYEDPRTAVDSDVTY